MIIKDGMVAIQHYTSNSHSVKIGKDVYTWIPKNNISLAWVKEEHLSKILNIKTKRCCGKNQQRFFPACKLNICLWETGSRC